MPRGRPKGIAREIADNTGLSIRTIQRALESRSSEETPEQACIRRFLTAFRNFASFCRENNADTIGQMVVTADQADKLREYNSTVTLWLAQLADGPANQEKM